MIDLDPHYDDKSKHLWQLIKTNFDPANAIVFSLDILVSTINEGIKETESKQQALDEVYLLAQERIN